MIKGNYGTGKTKELMMITIKNFIDSYNDDYTNLDTDKLLQLFSEYDKISEEEKVKGDNNN